MKRFRNNSKTQIKHVKRFNTHFRDVSVFVTSVSLFLKASFFKGHVTPQSKHALLLSSVARLGFQCISIIRDYQYIVAEVAFSARIKAHMDTKPLSLTKPLELPTLLSRILAKGTKPQEYGFCIGAVDLWMAPCFRATHLDRMSLRAKG